MIVGSVVSLNLQKYLILTSRALVVLPPVWGCKEILELVLSDWTARLSK